MPRYDYKCPHCQYITEKIHSMLSKPQVICDNCGHDMNKVFLSASNANIFSGFFDFGEMREITSRKQIKEIEKRENKVYGSDAELSQQTKLNKERIDKQSTDKIVNKIYEKAQQRELLSSL